MLLREARPFGTQVPVAEDVLCVAAYAGDVIADAPQLEATARFAERAGAINQALVVSMREVGRTIGARCRRDSAPIREKILDRGDRVRRLVDQEQVSATGNEMLTAVRYPGQEDLLVDRGH
jgi:hypothetical protein